VKIRVRGYGGETTQVDVMIPTKNPGLQIF
jgi:hypothetical protein